MVSRRGCGTGSSFGHRPPGLPIWRDVAGVSGVAMLNDVAVVCARIGRCDSAQEPRATGELHGEALIGILQIDVEELVDLSHPIGDGISVDEETRGGPNE